MPSDAKKKREQKKKEAAKRGKKPTSVEQSETNGEVNGATNGIDAEQTNGMKIESYQFSELLSVVKFVHVDTPCKGDDSDLPVSVSK